MTMTNGTTSQTKQKATPHGAKPRKPAAGLQAKARKARAASVKVSRASAGAANGYSESASRLITKGKDAMGSVYTWAGEASRQLPRAARNLQMPEPRAIQSLVEDKPLILGAVGLGIGVVLGALLPASGPATPRHAAGKAPRSKRGT